MSAPAVGARRIALAAWILLGLSVAAWPFVRAGIGAATTAIAFLPLLLPLPGIARGSLRALRASPMALAPALALAITETLANPAARFPAGATLALLLLAFAAVVAAIRSAPRV
jgi:uncharacterized membrane protein